MYTVAHAQPRQVIVDRPYGSCGEEVRGALHGDVGILKKVQFFALPYKNSWTVQELKANRNYPSVTRDYLATSIDWGAFLWVLL